MKRVLAIDPGLQKCGLILADIDSNYVLEAAVMYKFKVMNQINLWINQYSFEEIILGNGTNSKYWLNLLRVQAPVKVVEERGTTLRARERYWEVFPPRHLGRLIPKGLRYPPKSLDAIAAMVLLEDYLQIRLIWPDQIQIRIELEP